MSYSLLAGIAILIVYGSLYPFEFATASPDAISKLLSDRKLISSTGDILGNIGLFFPWGLGAIVTLRTRDGMPVALMVALLGGFVLAVAAQVMQIWVPVRHPSVGDVAWNLVGCLLGSFAGWLLASRTLAATNRSQIPQAESLLLAWLLAHWLPLVPSLDLQLLKDHLHSLMSAELSLVDVLLEALLSVLAVRLFCCDGIRKRPGWQFALLIGLLAVGKLFIVGGQVNFSTFLGLGLGAAFGLATLRISMEQMRPWLFCGLLVAHAWIALSPFTLRDDPATFGWLPFAGLLKGSMLQNVQVLARQSVLYAGILYLLLHNALHWRTTTLALALWALLLEALQTLIETRTAEITEPLLVLALGALLRANGPKTTFQPMDNVPHHPPLEERHTKHEVVRLTTLFVRVIALVLPIAAACWLLLRVPAIPYNVRELFRAEGNFLALLLFALAVLWIGGGAVLFSRLLLSMRHPLTGLLPVTAGIGFTSLALLWFAVTTESVDDITGSSNLYWFVTNKDIWGETARRLFLYLNAPDAISFIERCVRYSALYGPVVICLGGLHVARGLPKSKVSRVWIFEWLIGSLLLLWLCKGITFDWSSTDNLNELIARDGEWGWGGGGFLYALLFLICTNSLILAHFIGRSRRSQILRIAFTTVAIPVGWWLLNQGLETNVEKYGYMFSGVQFLLGPDRKNLLTTDILFFRWVAVQLIATLVIAAGLWLAEGIRLRFLSRTSH